MEERISPLKAVTFWKATGAAGLKINKILQLLKVQPSDTAAVSVKIKSCTSLI